MAKPIKIEIIGDDKSIKRAFGNVSSGISGLLGPLAGMGTAIGGAFAVDKLVGFGSEIFDLATDLGNIKNKVSTVFGAMAGDVATWADGLNEAFGTTATQVELMSANIADLLKPMGFSTEAATKMTKELVELAPALAQWSGGAYDASQVSEILASALLGEREQLKSLGISISQAEVDTRALTIAKKEGRDEVNAMDEALAAQQLIFEKSTDAQNGYTDSTDTLTGQQNALNAKLAEVKEQLAVSLTPAFLAIGNVIMRYAVPAISEVRGGIAAFASAWRAADGDVTSSGFPGLMERLANFLRLDLMPAIQDLGESLKTMGEKAWPTVSSAVEWALDVFQRMAEFAREHKTIMDGLKVTLLAVAVAVAALAIALGVMAAAAAAAFGAIVIAVAAVVGAISRLIKYLADQKDTIVQNIKAPFSEGLGWVERKWNDLKSTFSNPFGGAFAGLPGRAMGGSIGSAGLYRINERSGSPGGESVFLPSGSRVQPNYAGGGGNTTINVYAPNAGPVEVAREIAWRRRMGDGR